jgi:hypothetical protein
MFIHRQNLSKYRQIKVQILNKISIICKKINIKLYLKIDPPFSIFNDLEKHLHHKKKLNTNEQLINILTKLHELYIDIKKNNYDISKIKHMILVLKRQ